MSGVQVGRRVFPDSFKREAVERVSSGGLSAGKVAAELGIHETVLRRWMRQRGRAPAAASGTRQLAQVTLPSPADLAAENGRLRRENERLRMEREILKKTVTIFGAGAR
jgi:transposase